MITRKKRSYVVTEETRRKMSAAHKGKRIVGCKRSEAHKAILRQNMLGVKLSEETKRKISQGNKGKKRSEQVRLKMKQAAIKRWHHHTLGLLGQVKLS